MPPTHLLRRALTAALALAVVGLAGCSSDEATTPTTVAEADPGPPGTASATDGATTTAPGGTETTAPPAPPSSAAGPDGPPPTAPPSAPTTVDDPMPGGLPPVSGRTPIRLVSCEPDGAGHQVAVVELDVITDLPITGRVEVLFEDPQAVELERAIGSFDVIQPGESGQATVTSTAAIGDATTDCLIIGLEREEVVG